MFSKANESASGSENNKCNNSKEVISAMEVKGISKIGENSTEIFFKKISGSRWQGPGRRSKRD
jgi:hypothetical protein